MKALLLAVLLPAQAWQSARGEILPSFSLYRCAGDAASIAVGTLSRDETLQVERVVKGAKVETLKIRNAAPWLDGARRQIAGLEEPCRVVAFVQDTREGFTVLGSAGLVWIHGDVLYAKNTTMFRGQGFKALDQNLDAFLKDVQLAIAHQAERHRLLAMPAGVERANAIVGFLRKETRSAWAQADRYAIGQQYTPSRGEELAWRNTLLEKNAPIPLLLQIIGRAKFSNQLFDFVAGYIGPPHPEATRNAAILALPNLDRDRAAVELSAHLRPGHPELSSLLDALHTCRRERHHPANPVVVPALAALSRDMEMPKHLSNAHNRLFNVLHHYAHPRLVPAMMKWDGVSAQMRSNLRAISGLPYDEDRVEGLRAWSAKAESALTTDYDLADAKGRQAWYAAWTQSSAPTRRVLLYAWGFEPAALDEAAMLRETRGADAEAAKQALALLWQNERLKPETRGELVRSFLVPRLTGYEGQPAGYWHFIVRVERTFPFPKGAWASNQAEWSMAGPPPSPDPGERSGSSSLGQETPVMLASRSGPGGRAVHAVVVLLDPKGGWRNEWRFGPEDLVVVEPPKE